MDEEEYLSCWRTRALGHQVLRGEEGRDDGGHLLALQRRLAQLRQVVVEDHVRAGEEQVRICSAVKRNPEDKEILGYLRTSSEHQTMPQRETVARVACSRSVT